MASYLSIIVSTKGTQIIEASLLAVLLISLLALLSL